MNSKLFRIWGGEGGRGYQTRGSVLVNKTADGVSLDEIWREIQDATDTYNDERAVIANLLSFDTTHAGEAVAQSVVDVDFEEATEFGVPQGISDPSYIKMGFTLKDYDKAIRSTWKYLRDATADQITSRVARLYDGDNRLLHNLILNRLFSPIQVTNDQMLPCYGLWNGDGMAPPAHMGQTFTGSHTHYVRTNSTLLDAFDIETGLKHITHHGYGSTQAAQMLVLAHPEDVEAAGMTAWRAGIEYRPGAPLPKFDFIVSPSAPAYLSAESVHGSRPPADHYGIPVLGSYAGAYVLQSYFIPKGWAAIVASGGAGSDSNPIAVRHHHSPDWQGLRLIEGPHKFPLQDAHFHRTVGVGVRHRGAALAMQITENSTYTAPFIKLP